MYFGNLSVLLLLCFVSPGDLCKRFQSIHAVEEEYFSNCCFNLIWHKGQTVNWYKEKEGKWTLIQEDDRIVMNGIYLEFWPVVLDDSGNYGCSLSNGTHIPRASWFLDVLRRNKESCFNADHVLPVRRLVAGEGYSFECSVTHSSAIVISKTWYKNCIYKAMGDWEIDNLTVEDSGNYTCEILLLRAGKNFYQRETRRLIVEQGPEGIVEPAITEANHVFVKTEIGEMVMLNCSVSLGSFYNEPKKSDDIDLYWRHNDNIIEMCKDTSNKVSPCVMEDNYYNKDGKNYVLKQLWFESIKDEDLNSSYTCTLTQAGGPTHKIFTLLKGHNPDIPLPAFSTGIAMAILFFLLAIIAVILCAVFRVDLVLLYRDVTGKDETLEDGKTYDAFVSYLKDSMPVCSEERAFALDTLPQTLEEHFGYKLCIFERDISPGGAVVDDVQSFIDKSRRLIIILSKNYISDKVMFELETGLHKALVEKKIKVIIIEYMPIHDFSFLPKSLELLSSSQVVKWKEDKSLPLNSRFWKKLRCAMPAKSTSKSHQLFFHSRTEHEQLVQHPASHPGWCS